MSEAFERGRQAARRRFGQPAEQAAAEEHYSALPATAVNRGKLAAVARHNPDPAQRAAAAEVLRRWGAPQLDQRAGGDETRLYAAADLDATP
ncbi:MAG TPA: hypothetical protein VFX60_18955 [Micromonospora sp.]|nr:hypothetical protein [Micromonospora sp.]